MDCEDVSLTCHSKDEEDRIVGEIVKVLHDWRFSSSRRQCIEVAVEIYYRIFDRE